MSEIDLDQEIQIDLAPDPNEVEEMETIAEQLYDLLKINHRRFTPWEQDFIADMFRLDAGGYSPKQIENLYRLDRKYLR